MRYLFGWLACFCCATGLASDFSAPLPDVQAARNGSTISYQVFDPWRGIFVTGSATTPASYISNPTTNGGVVAWLAGSTVYYRIYDPGRSNWIAGSTATPAGFISDPVNDSGLVAWLAGSAVYFAVYDPIGGVWKQSGINNAGASAVSIPKNSGGMLAWVADETVWYVSYDPMTRAWVFNSSAAGAYVVDLQVSTGVAAWQTSGTVFYVVYDVGRAAWRGATWGPQGAFITSLGIANSTVSWLNGTPGTSYIAGYNVATGVWTVGSQTPVHAGFLASTATGNAPLFVWFTDLSLGGSSWAWNFGDGGMANRRIPHHVFTGLGRYTVLQTVSGPTGSSTAATNILTDFTAPSGSFLINNGDSYTRSNAVTLTITVTDNSGVIPLMRFSNDNAMWSSWVPYATNFPWTLSAGSDGIRSVYGQFMDGSSNISVSLSDSITLDTRPPPMAFITNYFVNESTPFLQVSVLLSDTSVFPVSVDFATSDGTASASNDYGSTNGRLRFINPGQTNLSFRLYITNDTRVELNETILLTLSNPTNATVGPPATVTILDDDFPTVSFSNGTFRVDEYAGQALITVSLNSPSGLTNKVNYASSNGTATAGSDYSAVSGTLIFEPGQTSRSFPVPIQNDIVDEPDETVRLYLSNPVNAVLGLASATLVILDDDPPPASFTTNSYMVNEAAGSIAIPVRLNTPFAQNVFVSYATSDGTARAGSDYVAASGTLVFAPGETNQSFVITILSDALMETNETILLNLTGLINATPGLFTSATVTIADDAPRLVASSWRTNSGFRCTLFGPPGRNYAIDATDSLTNGSGWLLEVLRVTNTTGSVEFTDPAAAGMKKRFYRARQTN